MEIAVRKSGPLFRRIITGDTIGYVGMRPDAVLRTLAYRAEIAGLVIEGFDCLSAQALRVGFITEACDNL